MAITPNYGCRAINYFYRINRAIIVTAR